MTNRASFYGANIFHFSPIRMTDGFLREMIRKAEYAASHYPYDRDDLCYSWEVVNLRGYDVLYSASNPV